jgi:hypothetical protein
MDAYNTDYANAGIDAKQEAERLANLELGTLEAKLKGITNEATAASLAAAYSPSLIVIANHVSDQFAKPNRDTSSLKYKEDFIYLYIYIVNKIAYHVNHTYDRKDTMKEVEIYFNKISIEISLCD